MEMKQNVEKFSLIVKNSLVYDVDGVDEKKFDGLTLGYITPWNVKGKEYGSLFASKFSFLSPCWYTVNYPDKLDGMHDVDKHWIQEIRAKSGKKPKIVPRFNLPWTGNQLNNFFPNKALTEKVINLILNECETNQYDGIVLDGGHVTGMIENFRQNLINFIIDLSKRLREKKLSFIFVLSPYVATEGNVGFSSYDYKLLSEYVDAFSVMSYDHSRSTGPNAPIYWQTSLVNNLLGTDTSPSLSSKLLLGIPFYGYDWNGSTGKSEPIFGSSYISNLKQYKPKINWNDNDKEHYYTYTDGKTKHTVYPPTQSFIRTRLELAKNLGIGISIWELGQGLPNFLDDF